MAERIFFVPSNPDVRVPNLDMGMGIFINPEGELLADSVYLRRRVRDGDLRIGTPPAPASAPPKPKK
jgi:hypothetical protein